MIKRQKGDGDTAPGATDREAERKRAYRRGRIARRLKEEGQRWLEPHYPAHESDLTQAWLDGWQDVDEEIARKAEQGGAA